jgi:hypothetical protein
MTKTDPNHSQRPLEEIIAYLDGELSEVESNRVEQRLSSDETYRRQMQSLDRVWSALDELPGVAAGERFSKTTMEMVVDSVEQEMQQRTEALPRLRRKRYAAVGMFVVAAVLIGALGYRMVYGNPNKMLLADLPVIERVDIFSQFQSLDFLRQLQKELGDADWAASEQTEKLESNEPRQQSQWREPMTSPGDRRRWIDGLTLDDQLTLRTRYNRFRAFSPEHQQRLRKLHGQLLSSPDAARLQETMSRYQQWLDGQPSSRQFELRAMPEDQRVRAIVRQVRENRSRDRLELTDAQIDKMVQQVQRRMPEMRTRIHAEMSPEDRRHMASLDGRKRGKVLLRWIAQHDPAAAEPLHEEVLEILTEAQREQFQTLSSQDQRTAIFRWLLRAGRFHPSSRNRRAEVGEQALEDFFAEELDVAQREELLALPRDVMRNRLKRLYWGIEGRPRFEGQPGRRPGPPDRHFRDVRPGPPRSPPPRDGFRPHDRGPRPRGPGQTQGNRTGGR